MSGPAAAAAQPATEQETGESVVDGPVMYLGGSGPRSPFGYFFRMQHIVPLHGSMIN